MIEVIKMGQTVNISIDEFADLIRAKEKLNNIEKLLKKCSYPADEIKVILDIETEKGADS